MLPIQDFGKAYQIHPDVHDGKGQNEIGKRDQRGFQIHQKVMQDVLVQVSSEVVLYFLKTVI